MGAAIPPLGPISPTQARLEQAYYELCTCLTSLRSNLALLDRPGTVPEETREKLIRESETAIERLRILSRDLQRWHAENASHVRVVAHDAP